MLISADTLKEAVEDFKNGKRPHRCHKCQNETAKNTATSTISRITVTDTPAYVCPCGAISFSFPMMVTIEELVTFNSLVGTFTMDQLLKIEESQKAR